MLLFAAEPKKAFPNAVSPSLSRSCSFPPHSPSSRLVQRPSSCRSLSKARLDIFYVQHVGFLRTTLIIYLFIPLLLCDSANMLHESAQLALKFLLLYCSPFAFEIPPFFLKVKLFFFFEVSSPSLTHLTLTPSVLFCSRSPTPHLPHLPHADPD